MLKQLTPTKTLKLFVVPIVLALLTLVPGASNTLYAATNPLPRVEIEQALQQQLPPFFELESWSHSLLERTQRGPLTIDQLSIIVQARLNEPLYLNSGQREAGKIVIRKNRKTGDIMALEAVAMVAEGMGVNQVQVIMTPFPQGKAGQPLSRFPAELVVIRDVAVLPQPGDVIAQKAQPPVPNNTLPAAAPKNDKPIWQLKGGVSDYAQLGPMLIDLNTLEKVSDRWGNRPLARIKNLPGRFWAVDSNYELSIVPFGAYRASEVHSEDPKQVSLRPLANISAPSWVAADLSRYVSLKDGDLWSGTLDWQNDSASAAKNLTQIGLLNNLEPIAWCERHFYFFRPQATEKPVLRIDTENGELLELATTPVLARGVKGSPDGCYLFKSDDGRMIYSASGGISQLHAMDLRTGDTFDLDATFDMRNYAGTLKGDPLPDAVRVHFWPARDIFWTAIGWYDLGERKKVIPSDFLQIAKDLPYAIRIHNKGYRHIPGNRYLDIIYEGLPSQDAGQKRLAKRYRIDRLQSSAVALPLEHVTEHKYWGLTWIDENRYVYAHRKGGLNEVGTWLYDITSGKNHKLSRFFADEQQIRVENRHFTSETQTLWATPLYTSGSYLVLPDKNRIVFSATRGSIQELLSVSLNGKELARKAVPAGVKVNNAQFRLRRLHPYDISLPFTQRNQQQSRTPSPAANSQSKAKPTTQAPAAVQSSQAITTEAEDVKAMCYNDPKFRSQYDCECLASKFMSKRQEVGPQFGQDGILGPLTNSTVCVSTTAIRDTEYKRCVKDGYQRANRGNRIATDKETYCQCYADKVSSGIAAHTGSYSRSTKSRFQRIATVQCKKAASPP